MDGIHQELLDFQECFRKEVSKVIVGQDETLELLLVALFCQGHVLLTGVPGLAKTLLINTLSRLFHLDFNRIQCTPDLMPSDISGIEVLEESLENTKQRHFRFIQGPVFTNLLLADEINRTSPRTQAALLQAMQEHQITISGKTYTLPSPFIVFATQNPIDSEGTYMLPEAQLDRFLFNIDMGYPTLEEEMRIAEQTETLPLSELNPVFEPEQLMKFQSIVSSVPIVPRWITWIVGLVRATRPKESKCPQIQQYVEWGAGVRASQNIVHAARAKALISGANAVRKEDISFVLHAVLRHRIILNFMGEAEQWTPEALIDLLLKDSHAA